MITNISHEYKTDYYKINTDKLKFEERLRERFRNNCRYNFKVNVHPDCLFFSKERVALFGLFKGTIEGTFSQRKEYSLLSIYYYSPKLFKGYHIAIIAILLLLGSFNVFNLHYSAIRVINLVLLLSLLLKDLIEYATYSSEKRKIVELMKYDSETPVKISMDEYHTIL